MVDLTDGLDWIELTETQTSYAGSTAVVNAIISNTGEGKTFASIAALTVHADRCKRAGVKGPVHMAIVRDTHENIKTSIVPSIQEFYSGCEKSPIRGKNDWKQMTIKYDPPIHVDLFGIDDLGALSRLQGPEYALIWLNEPAPMSGKVVNAGLSEEVFNAALLRCARQKGAPARLQIDMNPADEDHWTYRRLVEDPAVDPRFPLITKAVFNVPYGENIHLKELARQAAIAAYKDDEASYTRYVLGQFATVYLGPPVTPQYNRSRHLAHDQEGIRLPLEPAPGLVSFAFFDSWSNPSCVLGQITKNNRLVFLDTLRLQGSDIATLLELLVIPLLESPRWFRKSRGWRIGGDHAMTNMDQSNKLKSAAKEVMTAFPGCGFEAGPIEWKQIESHIRRKLGASDERGEPMILLSGDNRILDKGLAGGWHYRTNAQGQRTATIPVKDENSHVCDAFANAVCVLLPSKLSTQQEKDRSRRLARKTQERARNYVTARR